MKRALKKYIEEKRCNRFIRGCWLIIGLVAFVASFTISLPYARMIFALIAAAILYWMPAWLPSRLNVREQATFKMGVHPVAWAFFQGIYILFICLYLAIIAKETGTGHFAGVFVIPGSVGAGFLTAHGDEKIIKKRFTNMIGERRYRYYSAAIVAFLTIGSVVAGWAEAWLPEPLQLVQESFDYAAVGETTGLFLSARCDYIEEVRKHVRY